MPAKPYSVMGVSMTRRAPNSSSSPCVTLYAPWYSATSSPMTNTRSSRRISSAMASRNASRKVTDCILPLETIGSGLGATAAGVSSGCFTGAGSALALTFGAAEGACSSSSLKISAMTVPTFTPSVPSATVIDEITPSSTASNSIVALSVSISARISPDFTLSPSLTNHLAKVPSSIVGESAGILSSIAINIAPPGRRYTVRKDWVPVMSRQSPRLRLRLSGFLFRSPLARLRRHPSQ